LPSPSPALLRWQSPGSWQCPRQLSQMGSASALVLIASALGIAAAERDDSSLRGSPEAGQSLIQTMLSREVPSSFFEYGEVNAPRDDTPHLLGSAGQSGTSGDASFLEPHAAGAEIAVSPGLRADGAAPLDAGPGGVAGRPPFQQSLATAAVPEPPRRVAEVALLQRGRSSEADYLGDVAEDLPPLPAEMQELAAWQNRTAHTRKHIEETDSEIRATKEQQVIAHAEIFQLNATEADWEKKVQGQIDQAKEQTWNADLDARKNAEKERDTHEALEHQRARWAAEERVSTGVVARAEARADG